jgi:hypothetical protein
LELPASEHFASAYAGIRSINMYEPAIIANVETISFSKTLNYKHETEILQWTKENS